MSRFFVLACLLAAPISNVLALYEQCGGAGYTGELICKPPSVCTFINEWYSHCLLPSSSTYTSPTIPTISVSTPKESSTPSITRITTASSTATRTASTYRCTPSVLVGFRTSTIIATDTSSNFLFVNQLANGAAVLSSTRMPANINYSTSLTGGFIGTECIPPQYLSIDELYPGSLKPLYWAAQKLTNYWVVTESGVAQGGGPISISAASPYGALKSFLACGNDQQLFLQIGKDIPTTMKCKTVTLSVDVAW